jgi:hypothetical protein
MAQRALCKSLAAQLDLGTAGKIAGLRVKAHVGDGEPDTNLAKDLHASCI